MSSATRPPGNHYFVFAEYNESSPLASIGILTPLELQNIDIKADGGKPQTGKIGGATLFPQCFNPSDPNDDYIITETEKACVLISEIN